MLDQINRQRNLEARLAYLARRIGVLEQLMTTNARLRDQFRDEEAAVKAELKAITDGPTDAPAD